MVELSGVWDADEVAAFLADATVPIRLTTHRPDGTLWTVALWFRYRNGAFECATGADAALVTYLRNDPEVAVDVSTNRPPYRGVRGNGTAHLSPDDDKAVLSSLVARYLEDTTGPLAQWLLDDEREEMRIRVEPRQLYSWDYSARM
jgi:nitroimidazol reductase NimA-like FMN-containing flavoprotein (pyridoxamine 5'-phosphate oxidase superfamily)